ncbi:MAG TPA: metallopeptidase family protein [Alphaproteobacteria bacterium]|nr:metallopeptidase family protein [Alphaproteobacteria bacterium]
MIAAGRMPPTLADIESIAAVALDSIPEELRRHAKGVVIRVEDFPDDETLDDLRLDSPFDLLGLYRGVALSRKSVWSTPQNVDMIFLYRRPILDYWCESSESLADIVRHVLIHEIGHHFGFSDADMARIESQT